MKWWWVVAAVCACKQSEVGSTSTNAPRRVAKVTRGALADRVLMTGQLRAAQSIDLNVPKTEQWQLTIRWMAEDGILVKAGDKVLEFDNSQFTSGLEAKKLQVLEAQSGLRSFTDLAAMNVSVKDYELQSHKVALDKAKLLASVPADLMPTRTAQERQLDKSRSEAAVKRAEDELATERQSSSLEGRVKQIDLDKAKRAVETAEQSIKELTLTAPRDGVILIGTHPWQGRRFQLNDAVMPGFTIMTLPDLGQAMQVRADLSDVDDGKVTVGAAGTCTLDAYPDEPLPCSVLELSPVARGGEGGESLRRMFAVTLALDKGAIEGKRADRMRPGMSVKVVLPLAPRGADKSALLVPRGAIVFDPKAAPRVRLGNGELREIEVGECDAQHCVVTKGVAEGDTVLEGGS